MSSVSVDDHGATVFCIAS